MYRAREAYRLALRRYRLAQTHYHEQEALFRQSARRTEAAEQGQRTALARRATLKAAYTDFLRECYGEWLTGHPGASRAERLAAVQDLADACDVTAQQVMRELGVQALNRTREESDEDLRRYLAGMPVRAIARERRVTPKAIRNAIRRGLLALEVRGAAPTSDASK